MNYADNLRSLWSSLVRVDPGPATTLSCSLVSHLFRPVKVGLVVITALFSHDPSCIKLHAQRHLKAALCKGKGVALPSQEKELVKIW